MKSHLLAFRVLHLRLFSQWWSDSHCFAHILYSHCWSFGC